MTKCTSAKIALQRRFG